MTQVLKPFSILCVALSAALAIAGCGSSSAPEIDSSPSDAGIVGGKISFQSKLSQAVALVVFTKTERIINGDARYFKTTGAQCTGTFIERNIVLTAAHCVKNIQFDRIDISLQSDTDHAYFRTTGRSYVSHVQFKLAEDAESDLALISTTTSLPLNIPVMPLATRLPKGGTPVLAAGFGLTSYGREAVAKSTLNTTLRALVLPMPTYRYFDWQKTITIDNRGKPYGVFYGDSGGPLISVENGVMKQIGVLSTGMTTQHEVMFDAHYAAIPKALRWIRFAKTKL